MPDANKALKSLDWLWHLLYSDEDIDLSRETRKSGNQNECLNWTKKLLHAIQGTLSI